LVLLHRQITAGAAARSLMKPQVDDAIDQDLRPRRGFHAFYRAALPLSAQTLSYVAGLIRRHRAKIGSCWRSRNPGRQALLVLVHLRKGETFAELAARFGVGTATAWRYARQTIALLPPGPRSWARRWRRRARPGTRSW
jgi:hypothetical protein